MDATSILGDDDGDNILTLTFKDGGPFDADKLENGMILDPGVLVFPAPTQVIGGELIPIETTSLILANTQSFSWMIPLVLSVLGIGLFVVSRKSENS